MTFTGRALFSLVIVLLMAYMIITSFEYSLTARLFPATIGSVVLLMALIQFIGDIYPASKKYLKFLKQKGVALDGNVNKSETVKKEPVQEASWLKIYFIFICLFATTALMYYTQFLIAVGVFLFFFIWLVGKEKLRIAIGISIGTIIVMHVLFNMILKVTF